MSEIKLLNEMKQKASQKKKTIVLPESHDERVLKAAEILTKEKIVNVITLGDEKVIQNNAKKLNVNLNGVQIINPVTSEKFNQFSETLFELRKHKGLTSDEAKNLMKKDLFFGAMLVREGIADGSVAGSASATADVLRAAIQCVGMAEGISIVSSFFLMIFPEITYSFADCAVVPNPTEEQLADIAISTADNHKKLTNEIPYVAMLSFSTKGSAEHELIDKVRNATKFVQSKRKDLIVDGELQFDAAIVESVGKKKAPDSPVAGKANVLIFPDLNAGNIGYKIAQRLGKAEAIGPIVQGLKKPLFDLSRGCSVEDIVNTVAIAALMG